MKKAISRETLLVYPNFGQSFLIHMDPCKVQLGVVIGHNHKVVAFYNRKLNPTKVNYTAIERDILETLKKFGKIPSDQQIKVESNIQIF